MAMVQSSSLKELERMGVLVVVCDQEEEPLAKVVPGFNDKVLTLLTKDQKGVV